MLELDVLRIFTLILSLEIILLILLWQKKIKRVEAQLKYLSYDHSIRIDELRADVNKLLENEFGKPTQKPVDNSM